VIELDLGIVVGAPQGFSLSSVISREEIVPVFKTISPKFLTINQPTSYKGKVYFYNNYIFSEIGGSFLFISKMEQRSSDYDVSLILKSFLVKKIKVTEMQTIESKLQKSITELDESKMPSYPSYSFDQLSMEN
jgi:lipopolysaccharide biosynthesis protein